MSVNEGECPCSNKVFQSTKNNDQNTKGINNLPNRFEKKQR
jgi:hypothetical protein